PLVQRAQDRTGRRQDPAVRSVTVVGVTADHPAPLQAQHPAADPPHRPKKGANAPITWPRPRLSVADHRPKRADSALRFSGNPTSTTHPRRRLGQPRTPHRTDDPRELPSPHGKLRPRRIITTADESEVVYMKSAEEGRIITDSAGVFQSRFLFTSLQGAARDLQEILEPSTTR